MRKTLRLNAGLDVYADPELMRLEDAGFAIVSNETCPKTNVILVVLEREDRPRKRNGSATPWVNPVHDMR
jgi:hypothetical protein